MLVDLSKSEEVVLENLRSMTHYKEGEYSKKYFETLNVLRSIVEVAKVYVLDNYEKVKDWTEISLRVRGYSDSVEYFGMKDAERERRYPKKEKSESDDVKGKKRARVVSSNVIEKMMKDLDDKTVQVVSITDVVYDWTDGDFSLTINGKDYMWIDHNNPEVVITMATFIENTLSKQEPTA